MANDEGPEFHRLIPFLGALMSAQELGAASVTLLESSNSHTQGLTSSLRIPLTLTACFWDPLGQVPWVGHREPLGHLPGLL